MHDIVQTLSAPSQRVLRLIASSTKEVARPLLATSSKEIKQELKDAGLIDGVPLGFTLLGLYILESLTDHNFQRDNQLFFP